MAHASKDTQDTPGLRLDKWLWAARFFKTRELAAKSCDIGRVEVNGLRAKPSRNVRAGDALVVKNEGGTFGIEVLALSEVRGPVATAQTLYRETEESRINREREAEVRRSLPFDGMTAAGKPSKHARQAGERLRGRG